MAGKITFTRKEIEAAMDITNFAYDQLYEDEPEYWDNKDFESFYAKAIKFLRG